MLTQLVYASSAVGALSGDDLAQILRASRARNGAAAVTGALLYHEGNIMQVLEGSPEAVEAVYTRVEADPRHRGVIMLYRASAEERAFPDWSMGLVRPEDVAGERDGVHSLFDVAVPGPDRARRLLHAFRALVSR
ncbi:BLUF domain-containing protein [Rubrivirga marina]|uniref:BLUF domain-containing protein n=1 Tax=Rubrivirga marina TaxID=1196024 RepID=A0A271IZ77_9BACT|nr:BLUF domain-containing protein [Rubrivirga marina]PAP76523.1 hypothetical protein BSZ37_08755 [Rubrivirga marina]